MNNKEKEKTLLKIYYRYISIIKKELNLNSTPLIVTVNDGNNIKNLSPHILGGYLSLNIIDKMELLINKSYKIHDLFIKGKDINRMVMINLSSPSFNLVDDIKLKRRILFVLSHEMRHYYQDLNNLDRSVYKNCTDINDNDSYNEYKNQWCEVDANQFARHILNKYGYMLL